MTHTQVAIIGAGPAGLFLSHMLRAEGIDSVILERRPRAHLEARVRAGVLEPGTIRTLEALGLGARMRREGMVDEGLDIRFAGRRTIHLDLPDLAGESVMVYGQQEVVKDLLAARLEAGDPLLFEAEVTGIAELDGERPVVTYRHAGAEHRLSCDYVAACDGYHGAGRRAFPEGVLTVHEKRYDFAWLGVLSRSPPMADMTYCNSQRGFALCSRRSPSVSRLYLQVPATEDPADWSDDRFWAELHCRVGDADGTEVTEGAIFQKDLARLRAFVAEPMQWGRLFLLGDAAHIVPPTGAKGLNLAVGDARELAAALRAAYRAGDGGPLSRYGETCLRRVWQTIRFSTELTRLLHRFPDGTAFDQALQDAALDNLADTRSARVEMARQYVGLGSGTTTGW